MAKRIVDTETVIRFIEIQKKLLDIMSAYGVNVSTVINNSGMTRATFYMKIKNQTFTGHELKKVADFLNRE